LASGRESAASEEWPPELRAPVESGALSAAAVVLGGAVGRVSLHPELAHSGLVVEDLHRSAGPRAGLLKQHLGSLLPAEAGKFEALNAALWAGGILIHVPRGLEVAKPIHLLNLIEGQGITFPRVLIVAEPGSALTVIDEYVSSAAGASSQANAVVEIVAGEGSRVRYLAVQRIGPQVTLHLSQRASLARDGRLLSSLVSLGGLTAKADLGTILAGRGAEVEFLGFLFGSGRQHFDHHTVHDHRAGNTRSNLDFKVVLKDRSRSAYTGLIRIAPDAPSSEAYQENRNLLLNDGAKADSIPELEILTDEVMCTHGATMGTLDPDHVFYLQSRGIPRREAARIIVSGFVEPTLQRLPEDLRERVRAQLEAGLGSI
jgi:Fe-S cluster assembly protein SufD